MNKPDIEFDHEADCIKHRELGKGVTYEQDGVLFSSGFVALKILRNRPKKDKFDNMTPDQLRAALRGEKPPAAAKNKMAAPKPQSPRQSARRKTSANWVNRGRITHWKTETRTQAGPRPG